ncbi:hypothetical protein [Spirosoma sordidisoli]|uniref:Uncharacterized protein n=1 Tax=Spirosoma sordidisoli TaxID=2502893 RepID=A0A4Q2UM87_9BACT|nr:hypothetical protein [Spirosoma sordidisoli]RYC70713.1 hypothetical protein EQG79_00745 [Spirosoma sordidisoli]
MAKKTKQPVLVVTGPASAAFVIEGTKGKDVETYATIYAGRDDHPAGKTRQNMLDHAYKTLDQWRFLKPDIEFALILSNPNNDYDMMDLDLRGRDTEIVTE